MLVNKHFNKHVNKAGIVRRTIIWMLAVFLLAQPFTPVTFADFDTSPVRVNQVGYLPLADKVATIVTPSTETSPIGWELYNQNGTLVASGTTTVYGNDVASGDYLHHADFSAVSDLGTYRVVVPGVGQSVWFEITDDPYPTLAQEAMAYFYFHRLGEDLEGLEGTPYYRPSIHHNDAAIPCYYPVDSDQFDARIEIPLGPDWCGGELLNVKNSWADAGDFGIYPVNHAISAWTLLNLFERNPDVFGDGSLSLSAAEIANGIPDIIDEVNFGSTYLKGMLPSDPNLLASHKVHNDDYGIRPGVDPWWQESWDVTTTTWYEWHERAGSEDPNQIFATTADAIAHFENYHNAYIVRGSIPAGQTENTLRYAQKPSTAATYAVARVLAQLSRILDQYPSTQSLADEYWATAQEAWTRATTLPVVYAPDIPHHDRTIESPGGGDYPDNNVTDDRFAAAVEMYLTAYNKGDSTADTFKNEVTSSTHYKQIDLFNWQQVGPTGNISLISVPNDLPSADLQDIQSAIVSFANTLQGQLNAEGYPTPLAPEISGGNAYYPWGSNSFVTNSMMYFGYAYDISDDLQFLKDMHRSMDYLLGNNAVRTSFVTGYGEFHETDTHDRVAWALYNNDGVPYPKGWISGGPNNRDGDDGVTPKQVAPAKAYAGPGQVQAYASKENTINWNAPFVWVVTYMNEKKQDLVSGLSLEYRAGDPNAGDQHMKPHFNIVNDGPGAVNLNELTIRYWYSEASPESEQFYCDWAAIGCGSVTASFHTMSAPTADANKYVEIGFTSGSIGPGSQSGEIQARINKTDWSNYNESDDYSFNPALTSFTEWNKVTLYRNGVLVWGQEPGGSGTPSAPTSLTAVAGNGQVSLSWNATAGATSYIVLRSTANGGPYTAVQTVNGTSYVDTGLTNGTTYYYVVVAVNGTGQSGYSNQASATPGFGTTGSIAVQYRVNDNNPFDNQINMGLRVVNTGDSAINLSDVKLRYYVTSDNEASFTTFCDWAQVGCNNVQITVVPLASPVNGADHYVEIGFTSGTVEANSNNFSEIQLRVHKSDWSNLNETNDYSYDWTKQSFALWDRVTAHVGGNVSWGVAP